MSVEKTTGYKRASEILISSTVGGATTTTTVSMLTAFDYGGVQYADLTTSAFQRLSRADYITRRDAFISYLEAQYASLTLSADGSIITDPDGEYYI